MSDFINREELIKKLKYDPLFGLVERYGITGVIEYIPPADVVPWSWLEDFADERWASSGVYRFLIKAKEAYKRDRA